MIFPDLEVITDLLGGSSSAELSGAERMRPRPATAATSAASPALLAFACFDADSSFAGSSFGLLSGFRGERRLRQAFGCLGCCGLRYAASGAAASAAPGASRRFRPARCFTTLTAAKRSARK